MRFEARCQKRHRICMNTTKPMTMRTLSKSKLLAFRQCPKRLWLEVHQPDVCEDSGTTAATRAAGHQVGDIARQIYDPQQQGALIDPQAEGFDDAFARTQALLQTHQPIFEAGFRTEGALAFADVLLPVRRNGWRMVEVKLSTSVKDYHRDDAAVQSFLARACGVKLQSIAIAHINNQFIYPGNGDYLGLLVEEDLTEEAFARADEVRGWIADAQAVAARKAPPQITTGNQCWAPYECGFHTHCSSQEPQAVYPIHWLPRPGKALKEHASEHAITELRDVPDDLLNPTQQRVKAVTLSGQPYFDQPAAAQALAAHQLPAWFIDFETIQFAVPQWPGTRPYRQIPFQFSAHKLGRDGRATHQAFLDLSGQKPSLAFAQALIQACGQRGPVFVYNAAFERTRISELADQYPALAPALHAINGRIIDLLPIARAHYYHPSQHGSWSIKAVLPAMFPESGPDLSYDALDGVQDGGAAQQAYLEATAPDTTAARKAELERQLLAYCHLDTWAMVRLWSAFTGQPVRD